MQNLSIDTVEQKTEFRPGEKLAGTIRWNLPENAESVEVCLFWRTEGKGTQDTGLIDSAKFDVTGSLGQKEFAFQIPEGPYSFSGRLISIVWAIEATAYPAETTVRQEITVSPTGREVVLS
ncbi:MAG: hypothetical protein JW720_10520 [Sedimentisphaerales bacterium]|nr:hypothetical protein [Sedimentisphaerales bacterium]